MSTPAPRIITRHYDHDRGGWIIDGEPVDDLAFDARPFVQHVPGEPLPECASCPDRLEQDGDTFRCPACGSEYEYVCQGPNDDRWLTADEL